MQWAALGITRVKHVLAGGGTRVATTEELIATYPGLAHYSPLPRPRPHHAGRDRGKPEAVEG